MAGERQAPVKLSGPEPVYPEVARKARISGIVIVECVIDKTGNVLGERPGESQRPHLVLSAHLDTVFPEDTRVDVTREGRVDLFVAASE